MQRSKTVKPSDVQSLAYAIDSYPSANAVWISTSDAHSGCEPIDCRRCKDRWVKFVSPRVRKIGLLVSKHGKIDTVDSLSFGMYLCLPAFERVWKRAKLTGLRFLVPSEIELAKISPKFEQTRTEILARRCKIFVASGSGGSSVAVNKRRLLTSCKVCGYKGYSAVKKGTWKISRSEWDGSDAFRLEEQSPLMFTQRAVDACAADLPGEVEFKVSGQFI